MRIARHGRRARPLGLTFEAAALGIVWLAFALRAGQLGVESLWIDEAVSIRLVSVPSLQLFSSITTDTNPPLYYVLLHYWLRMAGRSEFAVRLLSVFPAAISIAVVCRLGRLRLGGRAGLAGALLLACSAFHVWYSQEARAYSLLLMLTTVSFFFFVRWLDDPSARNTAGYVAFSILGLYTHFYAFMILAAQNLYWLVWAMRNWAWRDAANRSRIWQWLSAQALTLAAFSAWAPIWVRQMKLVSEGFTLVKPGLGTVLLAIAEYTWSIPACGLILIGALVYGYGRLRSRLVRQTGPARSDAGPRPRLWPDSGWLLIGWFAVPHVLPLAASQLLTPIYLPRYTIVTLPAFYLLIAVALTRLPRPLFSILCGLLVVFQFAGLARYYTGVTKEPWRDVAAYVDANACQGEGVLFYASYGKEGFDYYTTRSDLDLLELRKAGADISGESLSLLQGYLPRARPLWLVLFQSNRGEAAIRQSLARHGFALVDRVEYFHISLQRYAPSSYVCKPSEAGSSLPPETG